MRRGTEEERKKEEIRSKKGDSDRRGRDGGQEGKNGAQGSSVTRGQLRYLDDVPHQRPRAVQTPRSR
jgi:hypothetical protein